MPSRAKSESRAESAAGEGQSGGGDIQAELNQAADAMVDSEVFQCFQQRHGIKAQPTLTVGSDELASAIVDYLEPRIAGKTVVEIGGGLGLLSLHMGMVAKRVFCIEVNPLWASSFVATLLHVKPPNVSYLFGAAAEFEGVLKGDVAVICSHSGLDNMMAAGRLFAPEVIDVYGELIAKNPNGFDQFAREMRKVV